MREEISRDELYAAGRDRRQKQAEQTRKQREDAFMRKDPAAVISERLSAAQAPLQAPAQLPQPPAEPERPRPAPEPQRYEPPAQMHVPYQSIRQEARQEAPAPQRAEADVSLSEILHASGLDEKTFKKELILYLIDFLSYEQKSINSRISDLESLIR